MALPGAGAAGRGAAEVVVVAVDDATAANRVDVGVGVEGNVGGTELAEGLGELRRSGADVEDASHYPLTVLAHTDSALHVTLKYVPAILDEARVAAIAARWGFTTASLRPALARHRC